MATSPERLLEWANGCDDVELSEKVRALVPVMKKTDTRPFADSPTVYGVYHILKEKANSLEHELEHKRRRDSVGLLHKLSKVRRALEKVQEVVNYLEGRREYDSDGSESTHGS